MKHIILASLLLAPVAASAAEVDDTPFFDVQDYRSAFFSDAFIAALFGAESSESDSYLHMTRSVLAFANYVQMTGGSEVRNALAEAERKSYPEGLETGPGMPLFMSACLAQGVNPMDYRLGFGAYKDRVYEYSLGHLEGIGRVLVIDAWSENYRGQFPATPTLRINGKALRFARLVRSDAQPNRSAFSMRIRQKSWKRKGRIQSSDYWRRQPYDARSKGVPYCNTVVRYVYELPEALDLTDDVLVDLSVGKLQLGDHLIFREQFPAL